MDINVYTTTLMPNVVKIEFDYSYNTEKEILSYEKVDKEKALIKIRSNDKELYRLNFLYLIYLMNYYQYLFLSHLNLIHFF